MKELIKESLLHQLMDNKIEPMEYIDQCKVIDNLTEAQLGKIAKAIQTRYPKAIANIQAKIQALVQARVQNPNQSLAINKKITRLKQIENNYRVRNMAWQAKSAGRVSQ